MLQDGFNWSPCISRCCVYAVSIFGLRSRHSGCPRGYQEGVVLSLGERLRLSQAVGPRFLGRRCKTGPLRPPPPTLLPSRGSPDRTAWPPPRLSGEDKAK